MRNRGTTIGLAIAALLALASCRGPQLSFTIPVCDPMSGACGCALPGWIVCHDACVDPSVSRGHCGGCDQPCPGGTVCLKGQCGCDCGTATNCGGVCAFTDTDPWNCGGCGKSCEGACKGGGCHPGQGGCPAGQVPCSGICKDLDRDPDHCGACDTLCPAGNACFVDRDVVTRCCHGTVCGNDCLSVNATCPQ